MPGEQKAIILKSRMGELVLGTREIPTPGVGEVLVEIHATSLNPVDWKMHLEDIGGYIKSYPAVLGTDCAGVVKQIGEGVTNLEVGDRVMFQGFYVPDWATFQQYTLAIANLTAKVPPKLTLEEAATIPLTMDTAAIGLYNKRVQPYGGAAFTPPWEEGGRGKYAGQPMIIMGGSSSVGQHVIQFAKLSGFSPIITTASSKHETHLKSIGATHIVDRSIPLSDLPNEVAKITKEPVLIAFDAISNPETQNAAYEAVAPGGLVMVVLLPQVDAAKITAEKDIAEVFGNVHEPAQTPISIELYKHVTGFLEAGEIKPNNVEVLPDGLLGIFEGLERLRNGKVSAAKLVARPQETPEY